MSQRTTGVILFIAMGLMAISSPTNAQQIIRLSSYHWLELSNSERASIQQRYVVNLIDQNSLGTIVDAQAINESTSGSNAGSSLGGAFGNAAYIDKAIRSGNYSAKEQLGANILGAVLGSAFNTAGVARFHFRYAVKFASGEIKYFDQIKSDAFRHPPGVCVTIPALELIEQQLCSQTVQTIRATYLQSAPDTIKYEAPLAIKGTAPNDSGNNGTAQAKQIGDSITVSSAVNGFALPSKLQQPSKSYAKGTTFEIVLVSKEFFQVIDADGQLIWIEKSSALPSLTATTQGIEEKRAQLVTDPTLNTTTKIEPVTSQINCKLGSLSPVRTSPEKCKAIDGVEIK
jgi:SH3-like domain-containing protein